MLNSVIVLIGAVLILCRVCRWAARQERYELPAPTADEAEERRIEESAW